MSLLTRLGRKDGQNQQVKIFALQDDAQDLAEELSYQSIKHHIHQHILNEMTPAEQAAVSALNQDPRKVEAVIHKYCQRAFDTAPFAIPRGEKSRLIADICDEMLGLGPLEPLLRDDSITEIMVNGPQKVFVERLGKLERTNIKFHDNEHIMTMSIL